MIVFCCICLKAEASRFSFIYSVFRQTRSPVIKMIM